MLSREEQMIVDAEELKRHGAAARVVRAKPAPSAADAPSAEPAPQQQPQRSASSPQRAAVPGQGPPIVRCLVAVVLFASSSLHAGVAHYRMCS